MEQQQISPEKQKALDKVERANAELDATSVKYTFLDAVVWISVLLGDLNS